MINTELQYFSLVDTIGISERLPEEPMENTYLEDFSLYRERDLWCGTQSQGQIIATYFCSKTYQVREEKEMKKGLICVALLFRGCTLIQYSN